MTYTTRQHLQNGSHPEGESLPYMSGWFHNEEFLTMMNMIGLPQAAVIECYLSRELGGGDQLEYRMHTHGWVMVSDEDRMALLEDGVVMFHMHSDRGGASFWLPVNHFRFELDIGNGAKLERVSEMTRTLADRYGWVERARIACKIDEVMGAKAP